MESSGDTEDRHHALSPKAPWVSSPIYLRNSTLMIGTFQRLHYGPHWGEDLSSVTEG